MSDKYKDNIDDELEEEKTDGSLKYEENDNWEFEATAHTLENTVVENDEFEIVLPPSASDDAAAKESADESEPEEKEETKKNDSSKYETRERPSAKDTKNDDADKPAKTTVTGKSNRMKFICGALISLIVILVLGIFGWRYYTLPNSDEKMNYGNVALTVGEEEVSIGMYNYYYNSIYQNYLQYAQQGYYQLDTTKDFSKQYTTNAKGKKVTWEQMFKDDTVDRLQYILALYHAGVENGVELNKEQKDQIKQQVSDLKKSASESEQSVDEYISEQFGDYCGLATIKKMLTQAFIANNCYRQFLIDNKPTEKEVNAYFKKNKDNFTQVNIGYIPIPYNADDGTARAKAEKEAAKYAKQVKNLDDLKLLVPKACKDLIKQYVAAGQYEDEDSCAEAIAGMLEVSVVKSDTSFPDGAKDWLFSSKTKKNTTTTFTDANNAVVYILLKISDVSIKDDVTYSVRHILVKPETGKEEEESSDTNSTPKYTKAQWDAAKKKADKYLAEYKKGKKNELSFATLAEEYSDDTESTSKGSSGMYGGLYDGVSLGQMVPSFEKWATDKSRKYGDTGIVKSDFGYHIMFFVENVPYYYHECEEAVINEKGDEFVGEAVVKYHNSVMEKTTVAKPEKASAADQTAQQSAEAQTQAATEAATQADNTVEGKDD
ncbi:MAG: peptidyl-prolyl cis-trans isomerase [Eubacterium sp.]|nr:peptidyl-prolyl cis-trans isomerase [Eubacterium sp.]